MTEREGAGPAQLLPPSSADGLGSSAAPEVDAAVMTDRCQATSGEQARLRGTPSEERGEGEWRRRVLGTFTFKTLRAKVTL